MLSFKESSILLLFIFFILFIFTKLYTKIFYLNYDNDHNFTRFYMGLIYLIFGLLKLYNLNKFANIFNKYDIIGNKFKIYNYIYPFIEIIIGILLIKKIFIKKTIIISIILMLISIISVLISLYYGNTLRCGCLGSFFHIPISYLTLTENLVMLLMNISYFKNNLI